MSDKIKGHLLAFFSCCVWGATFICTKILLEALQPPMILLIRFCLGLAALLLLDPHPMKWLGLKKELILFGAGISGVTIYYLLENTALSFADAGLVSVIICSAPFFVALCSWAFLGTGRPQLPFFIGFVISITGICLLSFSSAPGESSVKGILMAAAAAAAWGFYSVFTKKAEAFGYSTVQLTRRMFLYGLITMLPIIVLSGAFRFDVQVVLQPRIGLNLLFLGIIASALCFVTWNIGLKHLGALSSSVYIYLSPVITVLLSIPVLGEKLTLQGGIGIVLTLIGVAVSEMKR